MDPISLVVAAVVAGLTSGLTDASKAAVNDLYAALKARLAKKLNKQDDAKQALGNLEKSPTSQVWQVALKTGMADLGIEKDNEMLALARKLLQITDPKGAQAGKYNIEIKYAKNLAIGDNAQATFFSTDTEDEEPAP